MKMPHACIERLNKDQCLKFEDNNTSLDFIYVLKGNLSVELELNQVQKVLAGKVDRVEMDSFKDQLEDDEFFSERKREKTTMAKRGDTSALKVVKEKGDNNQLN